MYTFDNGTTIFYCENTGQINDNVWKALPTGKLHLRFYARDKAGNVAYDEVIIKKVIYVELVLNGDDNDGKKDADNNGSTQFLVTAIVITSTGSAVVVTTSTLYFLKKKKSIMHA